MKNHADILRALRIFRSSSQGGAFTTTCPECSAHRKKKHDRCLSVKLTADAVLWNCFNCGSQGGKYVDKDSGTDWRQGVRGQGNQLRGSRPARYLHRKERQWGVRSPRR